MSRMENKSGQGMSRMENKSGQSNQYFGEHIQSPDLLQSIQGFRTWNIKHYGELWSTAAGCRWQKNMHAICDKPLAAKLALQEDNYEKIKDLQTNCHSAPQSDCSCGLYGFFKQEQMLIRQVIGICNFWGKCEVHEKGIRAEYAEIDQLAPAQMPKHTIFFVLVFLSIIALLLSIFTILNQSVSILTVLLWYSTPSLCFGAYTMGKVYFLDKKRHKLVVENLQKWCKENSVTFVENPKQLQIQRALPQSLLPN